MVLQFGVCASDKNVRSVEIAEMSDKEVAGTAKGTGAAALT